MPDFKCISIPTEVGECWRRTGVDDSANWLRRIVDTARPAEPDGSRVNGSGSPCRHCQHEASPGGELLLGSYEMPRPKGIYWTPSPIFVHASPCEHFTKINLITHFPQSRNTW